MKNPRVSFEAVKILIPLGLGLWVSSRVTKGTSGWPVEAAVCVYGPCLFGSRDRVRFERECWNALSARFPFSLG